MGAEKYEILGTLGSGATGTVYLADEFALERQVAYKELAPALATDPVFLERFRAEARIMAGLDHPNCVKVWDFFEEAGHAVIVSEYIPGASLRQVLDHAGHLTPEQSLGVLKGSLGGLAYAHGRGLVHRDIKPENLLADQEGVSKLADFGQALIATGPGAAGGMPAGTPAYMSPEMVSGGMVDLRSDIYSLGAVLFEFLTGRPAFTGDNPLAVMRKHVNDPVPDPRSLNSDLPESVGALVTRAMAKDPEDRQRTAEQFLDELEAAAVAAYGPDWEKRSSIKRLVAAAAAALGVLLAAGAGALAATGDVGAAEVGAGAGGINKWLIAAGAAAGFVLIAGLVAFASGLFGGSHNAGGIAVVASPSPSQNPTDSPSPSPDASPSPSPTPSPSPSPSPSATPTPTPTAAPTTQPTPTPTLSASQVPTTVRVYSPALVVQDCGIGGCLPVANPQTYNAPGAAFKMTGGGGGASNCYLNRPYLNVHEAYSYSYVQGTAPISVSVLWFVSASSGTAPTTPASPPFTLTPPSGTEAGPFERMTASTSGASAGFIDYSLHWSDSRPAQTTALPYRFYWTCN